MWKICKQIDCKIRIISLEILILSQHKQLYIMSSAENEFKLIRHYIALSVGKLIATIFAHLLGILILKALVCDDLMQPCMRWINYHWVKVIELHDVKFGKIWISRHKRVTFNDFSSVFLWICLKSPLFDCRVLIFKW